MQFNELSSQKTTPAPDADDHQGALIFDQDAPPRPTQRITVPAGPKPQMTGQGRAYLGEENEPAPPPPSPCELFHHYAATHPSILPDFIAIALDLKAESATGVFSPKLPWETLRNRTQIHLKNEMLAFYVRAAMLREPRLAGVFQTKESNADACDYSGFIEERRAA